MPKGQILEGQTIVHRSSWVGQWPKGGAISGRELLALSAKTTMTPNGQSLPSLDVAASLGKCIMQGHLSSYSSSYRIRFTGMSICLSKCKYSSSEAGYQVKRKGNDSSGLCPSPSFQGFVSTPVQLVENAAKTPCKSPLIAIPARQVPRFGWHM